MDVLCLTELAPCPEKQQNEIYQQSGSILWSSFFSLFGSNTRLCTIVRLYDCMVMWRTRIFFHNFTKSFLQRSNLVELHLFHYFHSVFLQVAPSTTWPKQNILQNKNALPGKHFSKVLWRNQLSPFLCHDSKTCINFHWQFGACFSSPVLFLGI